MIIKTHPPMTAIFSTHQSTIIDLPKLGGAPANVLYRAAVSDNLMPCGPIYWLYYGIDRNPGTVFTVEIVLPVFGDATNARNVAVKEIPAFKCISAIHEGFFDKLPETYDKIFQQMDKEQLISNGLFREVYQHVDFIRQEYCLTEVQVGI